MPPAGFEDRDDHRTACASADTNQISNPAPLLPAAVDQWPNPLVVNTFYAVHLLTRNECQIGTSAVVLDLRRILAARDGASYGIEHENPAQGKLRHGNTGREQSAKFLNGSETSQVINSRERFPHIEHFAMTIKIAMIIVCEFRVWPEL